MNCPVTTQTKLAGVRSHNPCLDSDFHRLTTTTTTTTQGNDEALKRGCSTSRLISCDLLAAFELMFVNACLARFYIEREKVKKKKKEKEKESERESVRTSG